MLPTPEYIFNVQCTVVVCVCGSPKCINKIYFIATPMCLFVSLRSVAVKGQKANMENLIAR